VFAKLAAVLAANAQFVYQLLERGGLPGLALNVPEYGGIGDLHFWPFNTRGSSDGRESLQYKRSSRYEALRKDGVFLAALVN
jgi:hypothetical protein